jgi:hypothetical protein
LASYLDRSKTNHIDFNFFLQEIRGELNPRRQAIVDKAFLKFDSCGHSMVRMDCLQRDFNSGLHPKIQSGEWVHAQAFGEFAENFYEGRGGCIDRRDGMWMVGKQDGIIDRTVSFFGGLY